MTLSKTVHIGDINTPITATIVDQDGEPVGLAGATLLKLYLMKPSGEVLTKTTPAVAFVTDGSDGQIRYYTIAGDLDESGQWAVWAETTIPAGHWTSSPEWFPVSGTPAT